MFMHLTKSATSLCHLVIFSEESLFADAVSVSKLSVGDDSMSFKYCLVL